MEIIFRADDFYFFRNDLFFTDFLRIFLFYQKNRFEKRNCLPEKTIPFKTDNKLFL